VFWDGGVDGRLLLAVKSLCSCSEVCVHVGKVKSRPFTVGVGLRQECVVTTPHHNLPELDRQSQPSRRRVTVGSCSINRLLFADVLALLASYQQSLQNALDRFSVARDRAKMKISTKNNELCLSTNPRQRTLQVSGNTLQQVEKFEYLGWYLRVMEREARRLIHGLLKQTQFCVRFITVWSQSGSFQTPQSRQFLNRSLFRSLPRVMNLE